MVTSKKQDPVGKAPKSGKPDKAEAAGRAEAILEAAARLFAKRGYAGTSMQDLATSVGITKAGLYYFFRDKDEIYERVVIEAIEAHNQAADLAIQTGGTARAQLTAFCRAHAQLLSTEQARYVASALGFRALSNPASRAKARALRVAYEHKLRSILRGGIDRGEFREFDVNVGALAVLSCLNWMARWWKPTGPRKAEDVAAEFAAMLIDGFVQPAAGKGMMHTLAQPGAEADFPPAEEKKKKARAK